MNNFNKIIYTICLAFISISFANAQNQTVVQNSTHVYGAKQSGSNTAYTGVNYTWSITKADDSATTEGTEYSFAASTDKNSSNPQIKWLVAGNYKLTLTIENQTGSSCPRVITGIITVDANNMIGKWVASSMDFCSNRDGLHPNANIELIVGEGATTPVRTGNFPIKVVINHNTTNETFVLFDNQAALDNAPDVIGETKVLCDATDKYKFNLPLAGFAVGNVGNGKTTSIVSIIDKYGTTATVANADITVNVTETPVEPVIVFD